MNGNYLRVTTVVIVALMAVTVALGPLVSAAPVDSGPITEEGTFDGYDRDVATHPSGDYVAYTDIGSSGIGIRDISDPSDPSSPIATFGQGHSSTTWLDGGDYLATVSDSELTIYDTDDPSNPSEVYTNTSLPSATFPKVSGNGGTLAYGGDGVPTQVFDVSNPTNPSYKYGVGAGPSDSGDVAIDVSASGEKLGMVVGFGFTLEVYDVSGQTATLTDDYTFVPGETGVSFFPSGDYVMADQYEYIRLSDGSRFQFENSTEDIGEMDVHPSGDYVTAVQKPDQADPGLVVWDTSEKGTEAPKLAKYTPVPDDGSTSAGVQATHPSFGGEDILTVGYGSQETAKVYSGFSDAFDVTDTDLRFEGADPGQEYDAEWHSEFGPVTFNVTTEGDGTVRAVPGNTTVLFPSWLDVSTTDDGNGWRVYVDTRQDLTGDLTFEHEPTGASRTVEINTTAPGDPVSLDVSGVPEEMLLGEEVDWSATVQRASGPETYPPAENVTVQVENPGVIERGQDGGEPDFTLRSNTTDPGETTVEFSYTDPRYPDTSFNVTRDVTVLPEITEMDLNLPSVTSNESSHFLSTTVYRGEYGPSSVDTSPYFSVTGTTNGAVYAGGGVTYTETTEDATVTAEYSRTGYDGTVYSFETTAHTIVTEETSEYRVSVNPATVETTEPTTARIEALQDGSWVDVTEDAGNELYIASALAEDVNGADWDPQNRTLALDNPGTYNLSAVVVTDQGVATQTDDTVLTVEPRYVWDDYGDLDVGGKAIVIFSDWTVITLLFISLMGAAAGIRVGRTAGLTVFGTLMGLAWGIGFIPLTLMLGTAAVAVATLYFGNQ